MSYVGKTGISAHSVHALHYIWGYIGFVAETLIFMFAGVIMGSLIQEDRTAGYIQLNYDIGLIFACYVILHVIRFVCIMTFYPCLSRMGYGLDIY
jgi:NhaP-type Na+/H+ or K+/H+ antiporter